VLVFLFRSWSVPASKSAESANVEQRDCFAEIQGGETVFLGFSKISSIRDQLDTRSWSKILRCGSWNTVRAHGCVRPMIQCSTPRPLIRSCRTGNLHVELETGMPRSVNNVSRTALDSLKAKHSAICSAGYPVLSPFPFEHRPSTEPCCEHDVLEDHYRHLLNSVLVELERTDADAFESQRRRGRRQTPLVNVGYAMRVSTILTTTL
jgi:hypothetical protein